MTCVDMMLPLTFLANIFSALPLWLVMPYPGVRAHHKLVLAMLVFATLLADLDLAGRSLMVNMTMPECQMR